MLVKICPKIQLQKSKEISRSEDCSLLECGKARHFKTHHGDKACEISSKNVIKKKKNIVHKEQYYIYVTNILTY